MLTFLYFGRHPSVAVRNRERKRNKLQNSLKLRKKFPKHSLIKWPSHGDDARNTKFFVGLDAR
jgi:hypothetical protein